jgi:lipopolysaccharide/colanic/teichoic acid biosynthesis glycosyltransferase
LNESFTVKRIFDLLVSVLLLLALAPIFAALGVAIWLSDGRPLLFRQLRVGRHGQDFVLLKFRTMSVLKSAEKGRFDAGCSRRVTAIGKILRKTKLDEIPQLWNVLRGEMSLVGPRPEVRKWVEIYPERWERVLQVRPGITDNASIEYRNEENLLGTAKDPEAMYRDEVLPRKLTLYEDYVKNQSLLYDFSILFRTVVVVLKG